VDRGTVAVYEAGAAAYGDRRRADRADGAAAFAARVPAGAVRLDLGSGPGLYLPHLGAPVVAADAAPAMVAEARRRHPGTPGVVCDLAALPVRRGGLGGVWASKSLQHLAREDLPLALAGVHDALAVGGQLELTVFRGDGDDVTGPDDEFPGRRFTWWQPEPLADVLVGAGFGVEHLSVFARAVAPPLVARATRLRTLPDTVGPGMRLLMCGLNPSLYAADFGVGFARPGNRFWPALLAAGLAAVPRSPLLALREHGIGMTDLVKRATVGASELRVAEYRAGLARVSRLVAWLRPGAVCFVGLAGWRAAVDRRARPGVQAVGIGDVPVYVMPSTSGLNAAYPLASLVRDLRAAAELAG
jgi:double-stranded uracil-DNA glycosylase